MITLYLGTDEPSWLKRTSVPLFVSRRRLARLKSLPRAAGPWFLDSGGFTELQLHGRWDTPARTYAADARRYRDEVGRMDWAAPQDWMCEPAMLKRTGLPVADHQARTIANYLELRALAPDLPWLPVLQGWAPADYLRHAEAYERAGVRLCTAGLVGLGTVCRRQATREAEGLIRELHAAGLRLHGFGFKLTGLARVADQLASSDSMAWSFDGRYAYQHGGCPHGRRNCAHCIEHALAWRERALLACSGPRQMPIAFGPAAI